MTRIHPNVVTHFVTVLGRWLKARYAHKLEHYAAAHELAC